MREGQEVLFCEGACQCWYLHWCVGVTQARFQPLCLSRLSRFLCPACTSQQQHAESYWRIARMCARTWLRNILELKATVSGLQRTAVASTNELPTTRVNTKTTEETCKLPRSVVASRGCAKASKGKYPINGTANKSKYQYVENQCQPSSFPDSHSRCVPIEDASQPKSTRQHTILITRIRNIKNVTRCRDSRSAKSIETR